MPPVSDFLGMAIIVVGLAIVAVQKVDVRQAEFARSGRDETPYKDVRHLMNAAKALFDGPEISPG
jgi:hypothetical protein